MKKVLTAMIVLFLLYAGVAPLWAEGDKVHGDKGQGATNQEGANNQGNWIDD